jgi:hypothetical protein
MDKIELKEKLGRGGPSVNFGTIYKYNDHIYREIEDVHKENVINMLSRKTFMDLLHRSGLVHTSIASVHTDEDKLILEHEYIKFDSYHSEWCLPAKRDATLMVMNLVNTLIDGNLFLLDGHSYNVMFNFTSPKWIDFHSIVPFTSIAGWFYEFKHYFFDAINGDTKVWDKYWDFAQKTGIDDRKKVIIFVDKIREYLLHLDTATTKTPWFDYPRLDDNDLDNKQLSTLKVLNIAKEGCDTFLDIGCNVGWYSIRASEMGLDTVAIDLDAACISELYENSKKNQYNVLPLVFDFNDCMKIVRSGYKNFSERLSCDLTMSLALLHHLVFFQDQKFEDIALRLSALSNKKAIVQFVTREDSYVKHWINTTKNKNYDWYTMDNFIGVMLKYFKNYDIFESSPKGRKLILFEK